MAHRYTEPEVRLLKENAELHTNAELAEMLKEKFDICVSDASVSFALHSRGIKRNRVHRYTEEQEAYLRQNVEGRPYKELTDMFNKRYGTSFEWERIKSFIQNRGLRNGIVTRFSKGHVPANKGTHIGGWKPTQFKKGHVPVNYRPVGSERVSVDGYVEIKVKDPRTWRLKHRVVWEKVNGPVPDGYALMFANGNKQDLDLDNIILVSRRQLVVLNKKQLLSKNKEANKTALLIADLSLKIGDRNKALRSRAES